jgi:glycolate oxidase FAD binding subunit
MDAYKAIATMNAWAAQPLPLSAACHDGELLRVRLSGSCKGVESARRKLGGEEDPRGNAFWTELREHRLAFLSGATELWRLSVPAAAPALEGKWLLDWGGAQRWFAGTLPAATIRQQAQALGGHATLFRGGDRTAEVFHPLTAPLAKLQHRLKEAFDPKGILNPGRMYRAF